MGQQNNNNQSLNFTDISLTEDIYEQDKGKINGNSPFSP